jgi:hypothetical protein
VGPRAACRHPGDFAVEAQRGQANEEEEEEDSATQTQSCAFHVSLELVTRARDSGLFAGPVFPRPKGSSAPLFVHPPTPPPLPTITQAPNPVRSPKAKRSWRRRWDERIRLSLAASSFRRYSSCCLPDCLPPPRRPLPSFVPSFVPSYFVHSLACSLARPVPFPSPSPFPLPLPLPSPSPSPSRSFVRSFGSPVPWPDADKLVYGLRIQLLRRS